MKKLSITELQELQFDTLNKIDEICRMNNIIYYLAGGTLLGAVRHKGFIPWDDDMDIAMMRKDYDRFLEVCRKLPEDRYFLQNYSTDKDFAPALSRFCIKGTYVKLEPTQHLKYNKSTYIDIFPLDNVPDNDLLATFHRIKLRIIDRLITLKLYLVFKGSFLDYKTKIKKIISFILRIIPLSYLQKKRESEMQRYANVETKRICSTASKYGYKKQVMDRQIFGVPLLVKFNSSEFCAPQKYNEYLEQLYGDYMEMPAADKRPVPVEVYRLQEETAV